MKTPVLLQVAPDDPAAIRHELLAGLTAPTASVSPKYLYDALGSRLFAAITELPEYYPTRTEAAIFAKALPAMASALGPVATLVDLGAGNCEKAARLFAAFRVRRYVAVDISASLPARVAGEPAAPASGDGHARRSASISRTALRLPAEVGDGPRTLFYPGFEHRQLHAGGSAGLPARGACRLPGRCAADRRRSGQARRDSGAGLRRSAGRHRRLQPQPAAASQSSGRHRFRHRGLAIIVAFFDAAASRIEMHLEARRETTVRWAGGERRFAAGERIHTENSYKWRADDFAALLERAGFARLRRWTDERGWFAVFAASC